MPKLDTIIAIKPPPDAKGRRKGVVRPRLGDDPWRRRSSPRINFWDLAMVSTGDLYHQWEMLDFQPSIPGSFDTNPNAFISTYHDELLDKIFEVDVENWSTHYKRIVPDMDYGLSVWALNGSFSVIGSEAILDNANPDFTNAGLKADPQWFTPGYVPAINTQATHSEVFTLTLLGESALTHITTEYDINAASVPFTPSKKMDVFLVPSLPQMRGRIRYFDSGTAYDQQLNDFWHLLDRGQFLTASHPLYPYRSGFFSVSAGLLTAYDPTAMTKWLALLDYMKGLDGARARYSTDLGATWPTSDDGTNFGAVIPDPYPTFPPNGIADSSSVLATLNANSSIGSPGNPQNQMRLKCVIKQSGTYYYVWNIAYT